MPPEEIDIYLKKYEIALKITLRRAIYIGLSLALPILAQLSYPVMAHIAFFCLLIIYSYDQHKYGRFFHLVIGLLYIISSLGAMYYQLNILKNIPQWLRTFNIDFLYGPIFWSLYLLILVATYIIIRILWPDGKAEAV